MTNTQATKQDFTEKLIRCAIALLILNFLFLFVPCIEVYQPSRSVTTILGTTTYEGWFTQSASMIEFSLPAFLPGIPYLGSLISYLRSLIFRKEANSFSRIRNRTIEKPIHFFWLKISSIANIVFMCLFYNSLKNEIRTYEEHGAYGVYCRINFWGIINIICTIVFLFLLFILSNKSKEIFSEIRVEQLLAKKKPVEETTIQQK